MSAAPMDVGRTLPLVRRESGGRVQGRKGIQEGESEGLERTEHPTNAGQDEA